MSSNTIKEIRAWVTPSLVMLVGWFAKNKLEDIEAKLNLIPAIQQQVNTNTVNIQFGHEQVNKLRDEFMQHVDLAAKSEEAIILDKIKKTK